jgi:hypothetical protein
MEILIVIIIIMYLLPAFLTYRYIQIAFSKGGIWERDNTSRFELIGVLVPGVNLLACFAWIVEYPKKRKRIDSFNNFFNIKK